MFPEDYNGPYMSPSMDGGSYIAAHGYPTNVPKLNTTLPTNPITDPLRAGMQFGLLGAASGLGYSALRTYMKKQKPGGLGVTRDVALGALIGSLFGTLAAKENQRRYPETPVQSYEDVSRLIDARINKAAMEKQAIPIAAALPLLWKALAVMGAIGAVRSGGKAVGSATKGNWRGAAGHGAAAIGEGLLAATGAGALSGIARTAKGLRTGTALARAGQKAPMLARLLARSGRATNAAARGAGALSKVDKAVWAPVRSMGRLGGLGGQIRGSVATMLPYSVSDRLLRPRVPRPVAPRPQSRAPRAAVAQFLRSVPEPGPIQYRTLV
jgi:hypothetical protein